jgi:TolB-like protein
MELVSSRGRGTFLSFMIAAALMLAPLAQAHAYEKEVQSLSKELSLLIKTSQKKSIAVVDFTDLEGNSTALGRFLAEEFSMALTESAQSYEVIDRNHLATLLREHQLTASGLLSRLTNTRKLGEISGVQALVTGTLTQFGGENVRVSIKILDVNTAKLIGARQCNITQSDTITALLEKGIAANEVVTSAAAAPAPQPSAQSLTAPSKTKATVAEEEASELMAETDRFAFEIEHCERNGRRIECRLAVLNRSANRSLWIQARSRMFDGDGQEYYAGGASIASAQADFDSHNDYVTKDLLSNVPSTITVAFDQVPSSTQEIRALELVGGVNSKGFSLTFRNIPIGSMGAAGVGQSAQGAAPAGGGGFLNGLKQIVRDTALEVTRGEVSKLRQKYMPETEKKKEEGEPDRR